MTQKTFQLTVVPVVPTIVRKNVPGHYITIGTSNGRRGTYYKRVNGSNPNLLTLPGVRGVQVRYLWRDLEPTAGTYTFGTVKTTYPDSERTIRADLWRARQNNSNLIIMVEDRTFDGHPDRSPPVAPTNPMPADLQASAYVVLVTTGAGSGDSNTGYTAVRWNATVATRFRALIQALGNAFDADPNWYGIAFQETAIGMDATQRDATGYNVLPDGQVYRDAIIEMLKKASDAFPTSRTFWYTNFFPTPATDYRLEEIADTIKTYRGGSHGIIMGGPDILPDNGTLNDRVYPRFGAPPEGSWGELPLFNSMQFDSYSHNHTTATPDARMPGDSWTLGSRWTMDQLFRWARNHLHLNYVMWENNQGTGWKFISDASNVIAANPTFNT
jgi:hypothetical protein